MKQGLFRFNAPVSLTDGHFLITRVVCYKQAEGTAEDARRGRP